MLLILRVAFVALWTCLAPAGDWLMPNFGARLTVQVSNPGQVPVRGLATIAVNAARQVAPDFPGTLAIAMLVNPEGEAFPASPVASQADDLDGDGTPDQFEFAVNLNSGERRRVDIYYSTTLRDDIPYPKQVDAKHNYGYNFQTVTLESEAIGYRTYGAFFLDIQARLAGHPGLYNDVLGYLAAGQNFETGRDIFHAGSTLGLGGIFLRREGRVYQPPFNVPDYAHKPPPEQAPHYRVISQGPLRAIVDAALTEWEVDGDVVALRAVYSIDAGQGFVRCRFEAIPVKVAAGHSYEVGIGARDLPKQTLSPAAGRLIVTGEQDPRIGPVGLAVYYDQRWHSTEAVDTNESKNEAVLYRERLEPGRSVRGEYAVAAAWSKSGVGDLAGYLADLGSRVEQRVDVGELRYERTPRPEKVDAEAQ